MLRTHLLFIGGGTTGRLVSRIWRKKDLPERSECEALLKFDKYFSESSQVVSRHYCFHSCKTAMFPGLVYRVSSRIEIVIGWFRGFRNTVFFPHSLPNSSHFLPCNRKSISQAFARLSNDVL